MKIHKLTFIAACINSLIMLGLIVLFDYAQRYETSSIFGLGMILSFLLLLLLNYVTLDLLFGYYGKKQIERISTMLPEELLQKETNYTSFQELGEKFSEINQRTNSELDMMKEMESYRKEYIGNISHELKTPLFSIQGYIETLRDGAVENLAIRDKYLQRIDSSVERLINIVKDLDMINRLEAGEINLNLSRFDLNALVREIFGLLEYDAIKKEASLITETSVPQIFVNADQQKISQVLINLVANAIHYSNRQQAKITVKTHILKNKVLVEVSDNGMGIKPEALPRIFERFYRVDSSRNRKDGGSGLGLAIVKHILEAHGESISVESEYLEGTRFTFLLEKAP